MRLTHSDVFHCSLETLFDHIETPEKQKLWMKGLLANDLISGTRGLGARFRMVMQEGRKQAEYQGEVTAYEKPSRIEVRIAGGNLPKGMAMRADYRLSPTEGGTRLDYACCAEAEKIGFFMRLLMPLFKVFGRWQLKRLFRTLHRLVEAAPAAAA
jgi:uncharacterized protein YndB with AHSA1/START domain